MKRWKRLVGAGALIAGTILGASGGGGVVEAGQAADLYVDVYMFGLQADQLDVTLFPEVWLGDSDEFSDCTAEFTPPWDSYEKYVGYQCDGLTPGTYQMGFDVPDGYEYTVECFDSNDVDLEKFPDTSAEVEVTGQGLTPNCFIDVSTTMLLLDKVVDEDGYSASDFDLEVFGPGDPLTGTDTVDDTCADLEDAEAGNCLVFDLPNGDYTFGEVPVQGFSGRAACGEFQEPEGVIPAEQFPTAQNAEIGVDTPPSGQYITCQVDNIYIERQVVVTNEVVNDDGGTATADDFTIELYSGDDGSPVVSQQCAADGSCIDMMLPIGTYTVGETGPDGYTASVEVVLSEIVPTERIDDANATFTIDLTHSAEITVTNDDDPPPPTTTTVAPTTTLAPTTTAAGAGVVTLPATGSSNQNGPLALLALGLLAFGGTAVAAARRK